MVNNFRQNWDDSKTLDDFRVIAGDYLDVAITWGVDVISNNKKGLTGRIKPIFFKS